MNHTGDVKPGKNAENPVFWRLLLLILENSREN
jgi:hypothetical protein